MECLIDSRPACQSLVFSHLFRNLLHEIVEMNVFLALYFYSSQFLTFLGFLLFLFFTEFFFYLVFFLLQFDYTCITLKDWGCLFLYFLLYLLLFDWFCFFICLLLSKHLESSQIDWLKKFFHSFKFRSWTICWLFVFLFLFLFCYLLNLWWGSLSFSNWLLILTLLLLQIFRWSNI